MTYTNEVIGFDGHYGKREAKAATLIYCDDCAEIVLPHNPAHNPNDPWGPERLMRDGFGWHADGQWFELFPCSRCGKEC